MPTTGYTDMIVAFPNGTTGIELRAVQPDPPLKTSGTTTRLVSITADNDRRKHQNDGTKING